MNLLDAKLINCSFYAVINVILSEYVINIQRIRKISHFHKFIYDKEVAWIIPNNSVL